MSDDISNNNVPGAPWSGFWYDLTFFLRCNIVLLFSLFWICITGINIYITAILLCTSFVLDRIAVRKAEDVAIRTVDDFKLYAEHNFTEEVSNRKVRLLKHYIKYCFIILYLLALVEILIHGSGALSNLEEWRANVILYEVAGISYFYIFSAYILVSIHGLRITEERLKYAEAWDFGWSVVSWRWFSPSFTTATLVMAILFLTIINRAEQHSGLFDYVKYGAGFLLLAMVLSRYAAYPMQFKGAAYARYLGQEAKTQ